MRKIISIPEEEESEENTHFTSIKMRTALKKTLSKPENDLPYISAAHNITIFEKITLKLSKFHTCLSKSSISLHFAIALLTMVFLIVRYQSTISILMRIESSKNQVLSLSIDSIIEDSSEFEETKHEVILSPVLSDKELEMTKLIENNDLQEVPTSTNLLAEFEDTSTIDSDIVELLQEEDGDVTEKTMSRDDIIQERNEELEDGELENDELEKDDLGNKELENTALEDVEKLLEKSVDLLEDGDITENTMSRDDIIHEESEELENGGVKNNELGNEEIKNNALKDPEKLAEESEGIITIHGEMKELQSPDKTHKFTKDLSKAIEQAKMNDRAKASKSETDQSYKDLLPFNNQLVNFVKNSPKNDILIRNLRLHVKGLTTKNLTNINLAKFSGQESDLTELELEDRNIGLLIRAFIDKDHSAVKKYSKIPIVLPPGNPDDFFGLKLVNGVDNIRLPSGIMTSNTDNLKENPYKPNLEPKILINVLSARSNVLSRNAIRQTWANNHHNIFFMVGQDYCPYPEANYNKLTFTQCKSSAVSQYILSKFLSYPKEFRNHPKNSNYIEMKKLINNLLEKYKQIYLKEQFNNYNLRQESARNKDMVILPQIDSYNNLTLKTFNAFMWNINNFPNINYFMKIDDDAYLRADGINLLLEKYEQLIVDAHGSNSIYCRGSENMKSGCSMYIGAIADNIEVKQVGKWGDLTYDDRKIYPAYANGCTGYVVSRLMLENFRDRFYKHNNLTFYPNEDTCMGIWLEQDPKLKARTKIISSYSFSLCYNYAGSGNACRGHGQGLEISHHLVTYGHNLDHRGQIKCHEQIENESKKCFTEEGFKKISVKNDKLKCYFDTHYKYDLKKKTLRPSSAGSSRNKVSDGINGGVSENGDARLVRLHKYISEVQKIKEKRKMIEAARNHVRPSKEAMKVEVIVQKGHRSDPLSQETIS